MGETEDCDSIDDVYKESKTTGEIAMMLVILLILVTVLSIVVFSSNTGDLLAKYIENEGMIPVVQGAVVGTVSVAFVGYSMLC